MLHLNKDTERKLDLGINKYADENTGDESSPRKFLVRVTRYHFEEKKIIPIEDNLYQGFLLDLTLGFFNDKAATASYSDSLPDPYKEFCAKFHEHPGGTGSYSKLRVCTISPKPSAEL